MNAQEAERLHNRNTYMNIATSKFLKFAASNFQREEYTYEIVSKNKSLYLTIDFKILIAIWNRKNVHVKKFETE